MRPFKFKLVIWNSKNMQLTKGYARLYNPFDQFYSRYLYRRVRHCFNRPICSTPGATLVLKERVTKDYNWSFSWSGTTRECINLGSYNYLGFAEPAGPRAQAAAAAARRYGLATCSSRAELGTTPLHQHLEECTAKFLRVEAAIVFGMGFATNSLVLPALIGPGALVLSDEKNHASLILGLRLARVKVRVFKHNDIKDVERLARHAIQEGKWTKIVIVVEVCTVWRARWCLSAHWSRSRSASDCNCTSTRRIL
ncbi:aminotransferase class I and II domain-containing protein [Phthorimaea operculella]|nr:aminotransferase class I and II domain-containing protein [Phthorimaea operculella]